MRMLVAILALIAAPASAAEQFDLICKGQQRQSVRGAWQPYEVRYRIDLASKTYCAWSCTKTEALADVSAARIDFQASERKRRDDTLTIHFVDRTTGDWQYYYSGAYGLFGDAKGRCEPAAFSGFPPTKF